MNPNPDAPYINRRSMGQSVAKIIRERITSGFYSPGERLIEEQLSSELDISRFSIRDGLHILQAEDLIVRERNKQTCVISFDEKRIEDIYGIRIAIETFSVDVICTKNLSVEELEKNAAMADMLRKEIAQGNPNEHDVFQLIKEYDMSFHETLIRIADNQYCISVWKTIKNQLLTLYSQILKNNANRMRMLTSSVTHNDLLQLIKERDTESLNSKLHRHIKDNINFFIREIQ